MKSGKTITINRHELSQQDKDEPLPDLERVREMEEINILEIKSETQGDELFESEDQ